MKSKNEIKLSVILFFIMGCFLVISTAILNNKIEELTTKINLHKDLAIQQDGFNRGILNNSIIVNRILSEQDAALGILRKELISCGCYE